MLSTAFRNAASVGRRGSFFRPRSWTALSTCMYTPTWTAASLGISKGSWFFWGLKPRAEVSTEAWGNDTDRINEEGNIKIYYDEQRVEKLSSELETLIDMRKKAVEKYEEKPTPYQFRRTIMGKNYGESDIREMIIDGEFVDKTAAYYRALEPNLKRVGTRVASWARRFGKTTWLHFLRASIGVPSSDDDEELVSAFYKHLAGTDKGTHFLNSPLRPVVCVDFVDCGNIKRLRNDIIKQLKHHGLKVQGQDDSIPPEDILKSGIQLLRRFYKEAERRVDREKLLDKNGQSSVDDRPLILIDEYDRPWRQLQIAKFSGIHTKEDEQDCKRLIKSVENICSVLKTLVGEKLYGVAMVALVRLGGTGLSKLDTTTDLGVWEKHHDLFGISEEDLKHILDKGSKYGGPLTWDKTLSWANSHPINIVDQEKDKEVQKQQFLDYLKNEINGFETGFMERAGAYIDAAGNKVDPEGNKIEPLPPLYSPRDALNVIQNIIDDRKLFPQREWLKDAKDAFTEIIASSGNYDKAVKALVGGPIPIDDIRSFQKMSESLTETSDMRVLFYNLGLLRVGRVTTDSRVVLEPVISLHNKDVVNILLGAYKKIHVLEDTKVQEYYENPRTLVDDIADTDNLALVARGIHATHSGIHSGLPRDALNEKAVQDRIHDIFIHQFHHGRIRIARELHIGAKLGYMDFRLGIKEAAIKSQKQEEEAPLLNQDWRDQPSNVLPPGWEKSHGPVFEVKLGVDSDGKHKMFKEKGQEALDKAHRSRMLDALRQAWSYRFYKEYDPEHVWLVGITCWWNHGKLTLKCCAGKFVGREEEVEKRVDGRPEEKSLENVLVEEDLDEEGIVWSEVTV